MYSPANFNPPHFRWRLEMGPTSPLGGPGLPLPGEGWPGSAAVNDLLERALRRGDPPTGFLDRLHRLVDCLPEETAA